MRQNAATYHHTDWREIAESVGGELKDHIESTLARRQAGTAIGPREVCIDLTYPELVRVRKAAMALQLV